MRLFLSPHPDDEMEAWAALGQEDAYTVFVTLTHGEASGYCEPAAARRNLQQDLGERPPHPMPAGRYSPACAAARIDSWVAFLNLAAKVTPAADTGPVTGTVLTLGPVAGVPQPQNPHAPLGATKAQAWIGPDGARLALDLGDGNLTQDEVRWAVRAVLALRGGPLPDLPLSTVLAASYVNGPDGDPRALPDKHPDHVAVRDALPSLARLADEGAWGVTQPFDDSATDTFTLSEDDYAGLMGLQGSGSNPSSWRRVGAQQVAFGWLAAPDNYWRTGDLPLAANHVLFPRQQAFRHIT